MSFRGVKQLRALLIACMISAGPLFLSGPATAKLPATKASQAQQDTIRLSCPDLLWLAAQPPEGWTYPWGTKKLKFKSVGISDGMIGCSYSDSLGDVLTRPVPRGYECRHTGGRNIECKRIKSPIKIPGK